MSEKQMRKELFQDQFSIEVLRFSKLRDSCLGIIQNALQETNASTLPVQHRIKSCESSWKKYEKKKYSTPFDDITDFVAFRVICYLESDIKRIDAALRSCFRIDEENSIDRRSANDVRQVGYRSLHLVCSLGSDRAALPEYEGVDKLRFEVQVRTVLEHAWAEIEHTQNYKSDVALPPSLQRRLNIISATLELLDNQLAAVAEEARSYADSVANEEHSLDEDVLSVAALDAIANDFCKKSAIPFRSGNTSAANHVAVQELETFGVTRIADYRELLIESSANLKTFYSAEIMQHGDLGKANLVGLSRLAMIFKDHRLYFSHTFRNDYSLSEEDIEKLSRAIGDPGFRNVLEENEVDIIS